MVCTYRKNEDADKSVSSSFRVRDFACKCGRCQIVKYDDRLGAYLELIGEHFGVTPKINSGYRCSEHNAEVGGAKTSHHMRGMAADIRVPGVSPIEVARYAECIGIHRIGLYENFVHIGSDEKKRFWLGHQGTNVETFAVSKSIELEIPVLKKGAKSGTVKALQALLIGYGFSCGEKAVDGSFGSDTEKAVKRYQQAHGLEPDGSVGRKTWTDLLGLREEK